MPGVRRDVAFSVRRSTSPPQGQTSQGQLGSAVAMRLTAGRFDCSHGGVPNTSTFVGRGEELATVTETLLSNGRAVIVLGEAGIGKSRLVAEATEDVQPRGMLVLLGQCLPLATGLPLMPVQGVLRALGDVNDGQRLLSLIEALPRAVKRQIVRLLPETADAPDLTEDVLSDTGWHQERLFYAVRRVLTSAAEQHRIALVVEDVHWSDQASLDLIEYLLAPAHALSYPMVLTCRTTDHAVANLEGWLGRLRRLPGMTFLELAPLGKPDATTQIRSFAGDDFVRIDVTSVFERSEGNPFFIEQLVQSILRGEAATGEHALPKVWPRCCWPVSNGWKVFPETCLPVWRSRGVPLPRNSSSNVVMPPSQMSGRSCTISRYGTCYGAEQTGHVSSWRMPCWLRQSRQACFPENCGSGTFAQPRRWFGTATAARRELSPNTFGPLDGKWTSCRGELRQLNTPTRSFPRPRLPSTGFVLSR